MPVNHFSENIFENKYVFGSSDRFDGFSDRSRSIRTKEFLYVKNYFPEKIKYKDVAYRKQIPFMQELLELNEADKLNKQQKIWFNSKTEEELYDIANDPYQLTNLASEAAYSEKLIELRNVYTKHKKTHKDFGQTPELEMLNNMWPNLEQPTTAVPKIKNSSKELNISCDTKGASIAYLISDNPNEKFDYNSHWNLYSKPLTVERGAYLYVIAERIGYKESEVVIQKI